MALTPDERLMNPIAIPNQDSMTGCTQWALHPELTTLKSIYDAGDVAFFFNTGHLDAASTKDNYRAVHKTQLFAHNHMQNEAQRGDPFDKEPRSGYLGRLADVLKGLGYQPNSMTIDKGSVGVTGYEPETVAPTVVNKNGVVRYFPQDETLAATMKTQVGELCGITDPRHTSIFGETWCARLTKTIWEAEFLEGALELYDIDTPLPSSGTSTYGLAKKFATIVDLMLTRNERGSDRDVFFVHIGGFDTHSDMKINLADRFKELDASLDFLKTELTAKSLWLNTTIVSVSDFGRTLTPNSGAGSDHAWGGNYFIMGGAVKGHQALGAYPDDLSQDGSRIVGRGRVIPTTSYEAMWYPVAQWMADGQLSTDDTTAIFPNIVNTGSIIYEPEQIFD